MSRPSSSGWGISFFKAWREEKQSSLHPCYSGSHCVTSCSLETHSSWTSAKLALLGKGQLSKTSSYPCQWSLQDSSWSLASLTFLHTISSAVGIFSTLKENVSDSLGTSAWRQIMGDCLEDWVCMEITCCVALDKSLHFSGLQFSHVNNWESWIRWLLRSFLL